MRACPLLFASLTLLCTTYQSRAEAQTCAPPCRSGFACRNGTCISLCNPPCGPGERCVKGECELMPVSVARPRPSHYFDYLALVGGLHAAVSGGARNVGEVRLEFGSKYSSLQIGPGFGKDLTELRTAIVGHVPLQLTQQLPLFLIPLVGLGYAYTWLNTPDELRWQDIFLVPGVRLRYDLAAHVAIVADLIQVQINFLRLQSSNSTSVARLDTVPVSWNLGLGFAFLY